MRIYALKFFLCLLFYFLGIFCPLNASLSQPVSQVVNLTISQFDQNNEPVLLEGNVTIYLELYHFDQGVEDYYGPAHSGTAKWSAEFPVLAEQGNITVFIDESHGLLVSDFLNLQRADNRLSGVYFRVGVKVSGSAYIDYLPVIPIRVIPYSAISSFSNQARKIVYSEHTPTLNAMIASANLLVTSVNYLEITTNTILGEGSINSFHIANQAINSQDIANGAIESRHLSSNVVFDVSQIDGLGPLAVVNDRSPITSEDLNPLLADQSILWDKIDFSGNLVDSEGNAFSFPDNSILNNHLKARDIDYTGINFDKLSVESLPNLLKLLVRYDYYQNPNDNIFIGLSDISFTGVTPIDLSNDLLFDASYGLFSGQFPASRIDFNAIASQADKIPLSAIAFVEAGITGNYVDFTGSDDQSIPFAALSFDSSKILSQHLSNNVITSIHIKEKSILNEHLSNGAVASINIQLGAVKGVHLSQQSINGTHLNDSMFLGVVSLNKTVYPEQPFFDVSLLPGGGLTKNIVDNQTYLSVNPSDFLPIVYEGFDETHLGAIPFFRNNEVFLQASSMYYDVANTGFFSVGFGSFAHHLPASANLHVSGDMKIDGNLLVDQVNVQSSLAFLNPDVTLSVQSFAISSINSQAGSDEIVFASGVSVNGDMLVNGSLRVSGSLVSDDASFLNGSLQVDTLFVDQLAAYQSDLIQFNNDVVLTGSMSISENLIVGDRLYVANIFPAQSDSGINFYANDEKDSSPLLSISDNVRVGLSVNDLIDNPFTQQQFDGALIVSGNAIFVDSVVISENLFAGFVRVSQDVTVNETLSVQNLRVNHIEPLNENLPLVLDGFSAGMALGMDNILNGEYSTAWGVSTSAIANRATAWGMQTIASSLNATAWGNQTLASGENATVWGQSSQATAKNATAWGLSNYARGNMSTAWGSSNTANGELSTAWGRGNIANGELSTAWGNGNTANGELATVWGQTSQALALGSTVFGNNNIAFEQATFSSVWGNQNQSIWPTATVIGNFNATENVSLLGDPMLIVGGGSNNGNRSNILEVLAANEFNPSAQVRILGNLFVEGQINISDAVFNELNVQTANIDIIVPFSDNVTSLNLTAFDSLVWGSTLNRVLNGASLAHGYHTLASGNYAVAWGLNTIAVSENATAWGDGSKALAMGSTAIGKHTEAIWPFSLVMGRFNVTADMYQNLSPIFVIGAGTETQRANILEVYPGFDGLSAPLTRIMGDMLVSGNVTVNSLVVQDQFFTDIIKTNKIEPFESDPVLDLTSYRDVKWGDESNVALTDDSVLNGGATAWGINTRAITYNATAWGVSTQASGVAATAFGESTRASGRASTAWGNSALASGMYATAWGNQAHASANYSTAWGQATLANAANATAWGRFTQAHGESSTSVGLHTIALWDSSFVVGKYNVTHNFLSDMDPLFIVGAGSDNDHRHNALEVFPDKIVVGGGLLVNGMVTINNGALDVSNAVNVDHLYTNRISPLDDSLSNTLDLSSFDGLFWGQGSAVSGNNVTAWGLNTIATANNATAWGEATIASGENSTAWGLRAHASGLNSTAWGSDTQASAENATVWGASSIASSTNATSWGMFNQSTAENSTSWGKDSIASAAQATAIGNSVTIPWVNALGIGQFNAFDELDIYGDPLFVIGGGTSDSNRVNIVEVFVTNNLGRVNINGNVTVNGTLHVSQVEISGGDIILQADGLIPISSDYVNLDLSAFEGIIVGDNTVFDVNYPMVWGQSNTISGNYATAWGLSTNALADKSTSWGQQTIASGENATAWGLLTNATAAQATAWGNQTLASSENATAWGNQSKAIAQNATAWGNFSEAVSVNATAFGDHTRALAAQSTAMGRYTEVLWSDALVIGRYNATSNINTAGLTQNLSAIYGDPLFLVGAGTEAERMNVFEVFAPSMTYPLGLVRVNSDLKVEGSFSWGKDTLASGINATTWGELTQATSRNATAWGYNTLASEAQATAFGEFSQAAGINATAFGLSTNAQAAQATAWGKQTQASGENATAWGSNTQASAENATAWGLTTIASAAQATAFGESTLASAENATAWGFTTTASAAQATAWGYLNEASGINATVWGQNNNASGMNATAWGLSTNASAAQATAWGNQSLASGVNSTAWGSSSIASAENATAFGLTTNASAAQATAWGKQTQASGENATAWGLSTQASAAQATAWGNQTQAVSENATAWGNETIASAAQATAWGEVTQASAENATAWGSGNTASSKNATVWGFLSLASGENATAWGYNARATAPNATAWGWLTQANGANATAWGSNTQATAANATAWGTENLATSTNATAWGNNTEATAANATSWGYLTNATAANATSWGHGNFATSTNATAWGENTQASAENATSWGFSSIASSKNATAWGYQTEASAENATAWGYSTQASAENATAWGNDTIASAAQATAWGHSTQASAANATAWGMNTIASSRNATAMGEGVEVPWQNATGVGKFNKLTHQDGSEFESNPLFIIGNGSSSANRSNAMVVLDKIPGQSQSSIYMNSDLYVAGTVVANEIVGNVSYQVDSFAAHNEQNTVLNMTGFRSVQWGVSTNAAGQFSTAWGNQTTASGEHATAWGYKTISSGSFSTAWGNETAASGTYSTAWGNETAASGSQSTAWGNQTISSGSSSTAWGNETVASGNNSTAWGNQTEAYGSYSTAWGTSTNANQEGATAWGSQTTASGQYSTAWGDSSTAQGAYATSWGSQTQALGDYSTVWGLNNTASQAYATSWGQNNISDGISSTVFGFNNSTSRPYSFVFGKYNSDTITNINNHLPAGSDTSPAFLIGNGTSDTDRSNMFEVVNIDTDGTSQGFYDSLYSTRVNINDGYLNVFNSYAAFRDSDPYPDAPRLFMVFTHELQEDLLDSYQYSFYHASRSELNSNNQREYIYSILYSHSNYSGNQDNIASVLDISNSYFVIRDASDLSTNENIGDTNNEIFKGTEMFYVDRDKAYFIVDHVLIGTNNVAAAGDNALYVDGDIICTNSSFGTSDQRLKHDIFSLDSVISKLLKLDPVSFIFKNDQNNRRRYGFIAQDVQALFPDLVSQGSGPEAYLALNYSGFSSIIVKSIQEQQDIINQQEQEINDIKQRISELKAYMNRQLNNLNQP